MVQGQLRNFYRGLHHFRLWLFSKFSLTQLAVIKYCHKFICGGSAQSTGFFLGERNAAGIKGGTCIQSQPVRSNHALESAFYPYIEGSPG